MPEFNPDTETVIEIAELEALRAERDRLRGLLRDAQTVTQVTAQGCAVAGAGRTISVTVLLAEITAALLGTPEATK